MAPPRLVISLPQLLRLPAADDAPSRARGRAAAAPGPGRNAAPGLARLLAAAGRPAREDDGSDAALAAVYGIARQQDWPLAAIGAASHGLDPGPGYWLCADPVTLVAGRDDVQLVGRVADLEPADVAALLATLNAHFAADGLAFVAPAADAWFARVEGAPAIATRPLATVLGATLRTSLPAGADAGKWRRWQNEIQMLLHDHPVNAVREATGRPVANSLWFWGGGSAVAPAPDATRIRSYADGGMTSALARHAGRPARPPPAALDSVLADCAGDDTDGIVVALPPPLALADLERDWTAPAWSALASGALGAVTLIADGGGAAIVATARRPGAWARLAARLAAPALAPLLAAARNVADER